MYAKIVTSLTAILTATALLIGAPSVVSAQPSASAIFSTEQSDVLHALVHDERIGVTKADVAEAIAKATASGVSRDTVIELLAPDASTMPFFNKRPDVSGLGPGDVVEKKDVSVAASASLGLAVDATQYLFASTDSAGIRTPATATLVFPRGTISEKIFVFNDATDSLGVDCTPGVKLASGHNFVADWALRQGYGLLLPDHQGMDAEYAATLQTGHIVLDSIRVALSQVSNARFIVKGYSGGGLATYGASMLQTRYAEELTGHVDLWSSGGTPVDLAALPPKMNGSFIGSGLFLAAVIGLSREYPEVFDLYNLFGVVVGHLLRNACVDTIGIVGMLGMRLEWFADQDVLQSDIVQRVFRQTNLIGTAPVPADMIVYHANDDEWIPQGPAYHWHQSLVESANGFSRKWLSGPGGHQQYDQDVKVILQSEIKQHW